MIPKLTDIKIEVTHQCNLNCIHCSSNGRPSNNAEMAMEDCIRIISEATALGARSITFSGGEPFLWPQLFEAVVEAKRNQMEVSIYTTGHSQHYRDLVSQFSDIGLDHLIFSLFGATASTHERITRKTESFRLTKDAILYANTCGIDTQLHYVPTAKNYTELEDVFTLAKQLNVSAISILRLVPQGRASLLKSHILTGEQNLILQQMITNLRENAPPAIRTGSPYNFLLVNSDGLCKAATDKIIIDPNQHVFPCDAFKGITANEIVNTDELSVLSQCTLAECWEKSPYLQRIRDSINSDDSKQCVSCQHYKQCKSGCLAQKYLHAKVLTRIPDPDCLMQIAER